MFKFTFVLLALGATLALSEVQSRDVRMTFCLIQEVIYQILLHYRTAQSLRPQEVKCKERPSPAE